MIPVNKAWNLELRENEELATWLVWYLSIEESSCTSIIPASGNWFWTLCLATSLPLFSAGPPPRSTRQPRWLQLHSGYCWLTGLRAQGMMSPHVAMIASVEEQIFCPNAAHILLRNGNSVCTCLMSSFFSSKLWAWSFFSFLWCWPKCSKTG